MTAIAALALMLSMASPALASSTSTVLPNGDGQEPVSAVPYLGFTPPGFTTTAAQAQAIAEATSTMQSLHRRYHPLFVEPLVWKDQYWAVNFAYGQKIVAEADLSRSGRVIKVWTGPQAEAGYTRGHYAPIFDSPWVVVPFSLLFLIPFVNLRRLRQWRHLDALVLSSFLLSYWLFNRGDLEPAVWLVYPPLLYLLARMLAIGLRPGRTASPLAPWLSIRVLAVGLLVLVVGRNALALADRMVIDVGYASVVGASHIIHGQSLYFSSIAHPDTYGPIAYLAYVPFVLLFPWHGIWNYLPAAHAASLVFDLGTVAGLVLLGRRLRPGREGLRLGLALGWVWAACPFTLLGLMEHSNDGLIAMLSVFALLALGSPAARGALVGLATAAKFAPGALLPLFAGRRDRGLRGVVTCVAAFAVVLLTAIGLYLPSGGIAEFWNHTIGFQLSRVDVFSPWSLHPALAPLQRVLEAGAIALVLGVAIERRPRSLVQVSALAAAVTIAVQVPAQHWFYYYIIWFIPFVAVALLGGTRAEAVDGQAEPGPIPETVLATDGPLPVLVGS